MKKTTDWSKVTTQNIRSKKGPLLVATAVASCVDVAALAAVLYEGVAWQFLLLAALMLAADILFLTLAAVSNFRFKYARPQWIAYILVTVALTVATITVNFATGSTAMTFIAAIFIAAIHLVCIIVVFFAALRAAATKRSPALPGMAAALVVLLACTAVYIGFTVRDGYFGQGEDDVFRAVVYELDGDGYAVTGVAEGKGNAVVIPDEINGKEVTGFSASILADDSINKIVVEGEEYIEIEGLSTLSATVRNVRMEADRKVVDLYRKTFYDEPRSVARGLAEVANTIVPTGLAEDEVYVTFAYDADGLEEADGEYIPTYIAKKGSRADIAVMGKGIEYVQHSDVSDPEDMHYCYLYNDRLMMQAVNGTTGSAFTTGVLLEDMRLDITFVRVFRVSLGIGNDTKYTAPGDFAKAVIDGVRRDYSYVTADTIDALAAELPHREGFDLQWDLGTALGGKVDDLSAALSTDYAQRFVRAFAMTPHWTMHAPNVSIVSVGTSPSSLIYGDGLRLEANVTAPFDGCTLKYEWKNAAGEQVASTMNYTDELPLPSDSGMYTLTVTASASSTSLTSTSAASMSVRVSKRALTLDWTVPTAEGTGNIYSGNDFAIAASAANAVDGDIPVISVTPGSVRNAGTYIATASIDDDASERYTLAATTAKKTFSVLPYTIAAPEWGSEMSFVYDGEEHLPSASVQGVGQDGELTLEITGTARNAGNYTATVKLSGEHADNYTITDPDVEFVITPRPVTAVWENATFTYDGRIQYPRVQSVTGTVVGEETVPLAGITYRGTADCVGAGEHTVQALLASDNYMFAQEQTKEFTILQRALTVNAKDAQKEYDGRSYTFTTSDISVEGLADTDVLQQVITAVKASGEGATAVHAGITEFTLQLVSGSKVGNYKISGDLTAELNITKRGVTLVWGETVFEYNGKVQRPAVVAVTDAVLGEEDTVKGQLVYGGDTDTVNVGEYAVSATLPEDSNYTLATVASRDFRITKREVTLVWGEAEFEYNGEVQRPVVVAVTDAVLGEEDTVKGQLIYGSDINAVNVGEYTVSATLPEGSNYVVTGGAEIRFAIRAVTVQVSWTGDRFEEDGSAHTPVFNCEFDGINVTFEYYIAKDGERGEKLDGVPETVGSYIVVAIIADADNFDLQGETEHVFEITPSQEDENGGEEI